MWKGLFIKMYFTKLCTLKLPIVEVKTSDDEVVDKFKIMLTSKWNTCITSGKIVLTVQEKNNCCVVLAIN